MLRTKCSLSHTHTHTHTYIYIYTLLVKSIWPFLFLNLNETIHIFKKKLPTHTCTLTNGQNMDLLLQSWANKIVFSLETSWLTGKEKVHGVTSVKKPKLTVPCDLKASTTIDFLEKGVTAKNNPYYQLRLIYWMIILYIYIYLYIYIWSLSFFLFLILKKIFLMRKVKHRNVFFYLLFEIQVFLINSDLSITRHVLKNWFEAVFPL